LCNRPPLARAVFAHVTKEPNRSHSPRFLHRCSSRALFILVPWLRLGTHYRRGSAARSFLLPCQTCSSRRQSKTRQFPRFLHTCSSRTTFAARGPPRLPPFVRGGRGGLIVQQISTGSCPTCSRRQRAEPLKFPEISPYMIIARTFSKSRPIGNPGCDRTCGRSPSPVLARHAVQRPRTRRRTRHWVLRYSVLRTGYS
jgi:hypothetical protein